MVFALILPPYWHGGELIEVDIWRGNRKQKIKVYDHEFDELSAFFTIIHQDPVLSQVKLIAEAWDADAGGYQVGNFPLLWSEWNGKYRDVMRDFWRGEEIELKEFGDRFTGSPDLYKGKGRLPSASINFITCHDGFTLNDLVSYNQKHNHENGEESGSHDNHSWNCGVEGETDDPEVLQLRERQKRNFLTTLMLSRGVPMVLGGDEMGRSQQGNNNPYCQDNEISWFNWQLTESQESLLEFTRQLSEFRRRHPVFRQRNWLEVSWFNPDGTAITESEWENSASAFSVFINGGEIPGKTKDDDFLLCFNAGKDMVEFTIPHSLQQREWQVSINTTESCFVKENRIYQGSQIIELKARSMLVLYFNSLLAED